MTEEDLEAYLQGENRAKRFSVRPLVEYARRLQRDLPTWKARAKRLWTALQAADKRVAELEARLLVLSERAVRFAKAIVDAGWPEDACPYCKADHFDGDHDPECVWPAAQAVLKAAEST